MHKPLRINRLTLSFPQKTCFQDFTTTIHHGSRIAIMGQNGSGKSSLLNLLSGEIDSYEGEVKHPDDLVLAYVPQIVTDYHSQLSGGQAFNRALTKALSNSPNLLLLDEPTNHLDKINRRALFKLLDNYRETLIIVSHDPQLLRQTADTLWHIDNGRIHIFTGNYDDYCRELAIQHQSISQAISQLELKQKKTHHKLMKEQERAKKRKIYGENKYNGDKLALRSALGRGQATANKNKKSIVAEKKSLLNQLAQLKRPEVIKPQFILRAGQINSRSLLSIRNGAVGYDNPIIQAINFSLQGNERIAIAGANGSGKTTFIKAILQANLRKSGDWHTPRLEDIGYIDQYYATLSDHNTAFITIQALKLNWTTQEIREHLNRFLFRKNEEINTLVCDLSGGEKARLCLAQIAASPPKLLVLDELCNNLDLTTRGHIIQILKEFPAAILAISHDEDFLSAIGMDRFYQIENGLMWPLNNL
ncbi:TPA: ATP-binding cassette domain-containing protein [Legionella feeleii]